MTISGHSPHSGAVEALKPKMLDWSLTQIVGAPELLGIVLNNRTDVNKVGGAKRPASDAGLVQKKGKGKGKAHAISFVTI